MKRITVIAITIMLIFPLLYGCDLTNKAPTLKIDPNFKVKYKVNEDAEPSWLDAVTSVSDDKDELDVYNVEVDASNVNMNKVGSYKVLFEVEDTNNKKTTKQLTIEVVDEDKPTITLIGEENITILAGYEYEEEGAVVSDNYDEDLSEQLIVDNSTVDYTKAGTYQITYNVKDSNGNEADEVIRTIEVKADLSELISDPLEDEIREYLQKPDGIITRYDCETIRHLFANYSEITSLKGIEFLINLERLYLTNNKISDITPLKKLTNLKELDLSNNQISDISAIKDLYNLQFLSLEGNQIENITPVEDLINLEDLNLGYNRISDISSLSNLHSLSSLWIYNNNIRDIYVIKTMYENGAFQDMDSKIVILKNPIDISNKSNSYYTILYFEDHGLKQLVHNIFINTSDYEESYMNYKSINLGSKEQGYIGFYNDVDWYQFVLQGSDEIQFIHDSNLKVELYELISLETKLIPFDFSEPINSQDGILKLKRLDGGIYYLKVYVSEPGINSNYSIEISKKIETE